MDLRNLFKKQNETGNTEGKNDFENHAANNNRRFFFMVEDCFAIKNGKQCVVVGNIHGTIRVDDAVYLMQPHGTITVSIVKAMEKPTKQGTVQVDEGTDEPVSLLLDMKKEDVEQFSIITSIRPQKDINVKEAVENPLLAGLLYEMKKFGTNQEYFRWVVYYAAHSHFLLPMILSQQPVNHEDGTAAFEKDSTMRFPSLKDPDRPDEFVFPVFTDWTELYQWQNAPKNDSGKIDAIIARFPDIISLMKDDHCNGFVVNPFGQNHFLFDRELIGRIVHTEGYQNEFGSASGSHVEEVHVKEDTRVMLGVPAETEEVKKIREALITYGEENQEIQGIALLLQMTNEGKRSYLIYVDVDASIAKEQFQKMYETIKQDAADIQEVLFTYKGNVDAYDNVVKERQAWVYQKK